MNSGCIQLKRSQLPLEDAGWSSISYTGIWVARCGRPGSSLWATGGIGCKISVKVTNSWLAGYMQQSTVDGYTSQIRGYDARNVSYFFASEGRGPSTRMYTSSTPIWAVMKYPSVAKICSRGWEEISTQKVVNNLGLSSCNLTIPVWTMTKIR